jgi:uncharacterized LabA/DUF88 family protein
MTQRAIFFIDGSNWYHSLKRQDIGAPGELDYAKISQKLAGTREWIETRYYIGALNQASNPGAYADQRRFLSRLQNTDQRIRILLGRLEPRPEPNPLAAELHRWIDSRPDDLVPGSQEWLRARADAHTNVWTLKEKAVDIMLAVDLIRLAGDDRYDAAYVLSADGDFTPAVEAVRASGRTVYGVSPDRSYALAKSVNTYIHLRKVWFRDCYRT